MPFSIQVHRTGTGEFHAAGNPAMDLHPFQGGVEILLVSSCYRNGDKLRPDEPLGFIFYLPSFDVLQKDVCLF